MADYVFDPPPNPSVAIRGRSERFPVRRILCVGRNYAAHAREMGRDPSRELPFFFTKPADAVVDTDTTVAYPAMTELLHHEVELVVAIGATATKVAAEDARECIWGYAVGIDLTRRDLQLAAREAGRPWDWGKAFDQSAPVAPIHPVENVGHPDSGRIWLEVKGEVRQEADLAELIWSCAEIVSIASHAMTLRPGDLIFTGTPAGVGELRVGDEIVGGIEGLGEIRLRVGSRA